MTAPIAKATSATATTALAGLPLMHTAIPLGGSVENARPTLTGFQPSVTFDREVVTATPQLLDADVTFSDADNNFDGGSLTLSGLLTEDVASVRNEGTDAGQIGLSGSDVTYAGTVIGTLAGGVGATLTITFNAVATSTAIDALIQNLTYANTSNTPAASRTLVLDVVDGEGADIGPGAGVTASFTQLSGAASPFNGIDVGQFSAPAFTDLDGDGDLDLVIGNRSGTLSVFRNGTDQAPGTFTQLTGAADPFSGVDIGDEAKPSFIDLDGDGDMDAVVGETEGTLKVFQNGTTTAAGAFTELTGAANPFNGLDVGDYLKQAFVDLDDDGDLDLVAGEFLGKLLTYRNGTDGAAGAYTQLTGADNPFNGVDVGEEAAPAFVDLDGDGDLDLVAGNRIGELNVFRNGSEFAPGAFVELTGSSNPFDGVTLGNYVLPAFVDLDGDGDLDAVMGQESGQLVTFTNTIPSGTPITVTLEDTNDAPTLTGDLTATVTEGGDYTLTTADLGFSDSDDVNSGIVFTASAIQNGTIIVNVPSPKGVSGNSAFLTTSFTASDLVQGRVVFRHDNTDTTTASFNVSVEDGNEDNSQPVAQAFTFAVTPVGDSTIGDLVWNDENGDGILNVDESGFSGVQLELLDSSGSVIDTTTTDQNGAYSFTGVVSGTYTVRIAASNFAQFGTLADFTGSTYDLDGLGTLNEASVTVTEPASSLNVDFGYRNAAPTAILGMLAVAEFSAIDTVVGTLSATDADSSSFTYRLVDDAGGRFTLVENEVRVLNQFLLDHEQSAAHTIRVEVTDDAGRTFEQDLTVTVGDVSPETVTGNQNGNRFVGDIGADNLKGAGGDDTLDGGDGNDTIYGDDGADLIFGGDGDDALYGDDVLGKGVGGDTLDGGAGNDVLTGGALADLLRGGTGDDVYVDVFGDTIVELSGGGVDTIQTFSTMLLSGIQHVENLTLMGTGSINATGNYANNVLTGNEGDNRLRGSQGFDTLIGGLGNDTYVDPTDDVIIELADGGTDTIEIGQSFSLGGSGIVTFGAPPNDFQHVENLTLTGRSVINGEGNNADNVITGNEGANSLTGWLGNDTLIGGLGNDTLTGGQGNDTYVIDAGDLIVELAGEGTDTVAFSRTVDLAAYASIENILLTGSVNAFGIGNTMDNAITGNIGNNLLRGGDGNDTLSGGEGVDTLNGGAGDDTYIDPAGDVIIEGVNGGTDTIVSESTTTLSGRQQVENLTLTGYDDINGTGNSYANVITGNEGANRLEGRGGADTLIGGGGDDTYVDPTGDTIRESAFGGSDTVETSVNFSLSGIAHVENITLTGTSNASASGNYADNVLTGNAGANRLRGSVGADTLDGGAGADTFVYGAVAESNGAVHDVVLNADLDLDRFDFNLGATNLVPSSIAASLTTGALNEASFDYDLAAALGAGQLGAGQAILFTADAGDLAAEGQSYLVVDANGIAGYQAGADYVVQLMNHTGSLTLDDFI